MRVFKHHTQTHKWLESSICTCLDIPSVAGECFTFSFAMFILSWRYVFFFFTYKAYDGSHLDLQCCYASQIWLCPLKSVCHNDLTMWHGADNIYFIHSSRCFSFYSSGESEYFQHFVVFQWLLWQQTILDLPNPESLTLRSVVLFIDSDSLTGTQARICNSQLQSLPHNVIIFITYYIHRITFKKCII